jgi:2,3-bisphosphoglycerate-dependent phosphoglycerate mutase
VRRDPAAAERARYVLIVAHQVIVLCLRYLLESLTEDEILAIDRAAEVANCGVTSYVLDCNAGPDGLLRLQTYNFVLPLEEGGATVTSQPDAPAGAK